MARRPILAHLDQQGIAVAVRRDGDDVLHVARSLALAPEFLPAAAPEAGAPLGHRNAQALRVHVREREHLLGSSTLATIEQPLKSKLH